MTRGINRFKGLEIALCEVDSNDRKIEGLDELVKWVESAKELSNDSLVKHMKEHEAPILLKALAWSEEVNRQVEQLPETEKVPFGGVRLAIEALHRTADVAVVSSANQQAIMEAVSYTHLDVYKRQDKSQVPYADVTSMNMNYRDKFFNGQIAMLPIGNFIVPELDDQDKYPHDFVDVYKRQGVTRADHFSSIFLINFLIRRWSRLQITWLCMERTA